MALSPSDATVQTSVSHLEYVATETRSRRDGFLAEIENLPTVGQAAQDAGTGPSEGRRAGRPPIGLRACRACVWHSSAAVYQTKARAQPVREPPIR